MSYLDICKCFRIKASELEKIDQIIKKSDEKYQNLSHFIRCAIITKIKEEERELLSRKIKSIPND